MLHIYTNQLNLNQGANVMPYLILTIKKEPGKKKRRRMAAFERTSLQLYRDCLRLATRIGGRSAKGIAMRSMIKTEFAKNKEETDEVKIAEQKNAAIRALSNYLIYQSSAKDERLAANVNRKNNDTDN